ncbi:hypothetical protein (plasmid) [Vibrio vulnificus YJ016]|uniref:Uncharacterized protein n=1 Tax=Vibrio vulnificus (strain YJ016) TaxID=196600 RepID=Q7MBL8_VIBVY|nr:hypothetical protein [Vibrio vulnificus YJ016]
MAAPEADFNGLIESMSLFPYATQIAAGSNAERCVVARMKLKSLAVTRLG